MIMVLRLYSIEVFSSSVFNFESKVRVIRYILVYCVQSVVDISLEQMGLK